MKEKIIQLMPVQNNMYLVSNCKDTETGKSISCEEKIVALALFYDGDVGFIIINNENMLDIEKNYAQEIIFK